MTPAPRQYRCTAAACIALSTFSLPSSAAPIVDNFESYALGAFPSPTWSDVAAVVPYPGSNAPTPSASVVSTLDAQGLATQALQTVGDRGFSKGIYAAVPVSTSYSLFADIRTLRYADSQAPRAAPSSDWSMQLTFAQSGTDNFAFTPQAGLYASSLTSTWRFFLISSNGGPTEDFDLGIAADADIWYTVSMEMDASTGTFRSRIRNTATGTLLVDDTHAVAGWDPGFGRFDAISFFGGETAFNTPGLPGDTTLGSIAQVDNINVTTVPVPLPATLALLGIGWAAMRTGRNRPTAS